MGSRPQLSRIWLGAAVLLVLAGWLLTGSPALAAPPTLGIESDTVGPGESLTVEVYLVDLEVGESWELNIRRESDDGLAPACHGEGMGVETELGADAPLVFTMETSPNCPVVSYYFELRYTVLLDGGPHLHLGDPRLRPLVYFPGAADPRGRPVGIGDLGHPREGAGRHRDRTVGQHSFCRQPWSQRVCGQRVQPPVRRDPG